MPIPCPHFKITIVKRSQGQSAVAGAAYQSGERLFSEYDQKTKFYNKKKELVHAEIMLPSHAPPGFADRATLWNAVEAVENQWNSQLARRIVLALPREVPKDQYFEEIRQEVDYLKAHSLNTIEDLDTAISNLSQTAAPLRKQLKQNENRMRAIAQIKDAAAVHAKLKHIHDAFIKKNFKLTKDAYAAQHKDELDAFNKAVRTLMKLNGSTEANFSALDAEFSALQSGSAELRSQLEALQPDLTALKNVRKYIDLVLNKQQFSTPGGKTPEKESVLKKLNDSKAALEQKKSQTQPKESEHTL